MPDYILKERTIPFDEMSAPSIPTSSDAISLAMAPTYPTLTNNCDAQADDPHN